MDANLESVSTLIATDSSSSSSVSSPFLGQLELNGLTVGPINLLPNEMMHLIMAKLGFDGDVKKLIRLRLVSTKWRSLVEDYCGLKKFLSVIRIGRYQTTAEEIVKGDFFGFGSSKDVRLILNAQIPSEYLTSFLKYFPNIVQLSVEWEEQSQVPDFVHYMQSLGSLKQLKLNGQFVSTLSSLAAILSKLENISLYCFPVNGSMHNDDHLQLISHLGPECGRVKFALPTRFYSHQIQQWHSINPHWLTNLTHLHIYIHHNSDEFGQAVRFLGEHTKLKLLHYQSWPYDRNLQLTSNVIRDLGKLTHLTELKLWQIEIDFSELEQAARLKQLASLASVLTCKLAFYLRYRLPQENGDLFTKVLSTIFPKLAHLKLYIAPYAHPDNITMLQQQLGQEIEQHLYRFKNLIVNRIDFIQGMFNP